MAVPEAVRGAPDWLPPGARVFDLVERTFLEHARLAGYERVRVPVFEHTELFTRGVGASTDVVQKEMYTFVDKGGRSLTLRPEGTAGVVRAALQAGVSRSGALPAKYAYAGEFFRHERPQAGRLRQFTQVGVEALGSDDPVLDAEVVMVGWEALRAAGVADLVLRVNSLGDREDRADYHAALNAYLDRFDDLPPDVQARRRLNPLRAFDSKAPGMPAIMADAPLLGDHIGEAAKQHHAAVVELLRDQGLPLTHDPRLVRGLDYYTRTTFEYQVGTLGAQNAVGGGGRYDNLVEMLGGRPTPGVGFGSGLERLLIALESQGVTIPTVGKPLVWLIAHGDAARDHNAALLRELREAGVAADADPSGRSVKAQFKLAERERAAYAIVVGENEMAAGTVVLKDLAKRAETTVPRGEVTARLKQP
jgi:histidyl-tRNA synthetase